MFAVDSTTGQITTTQSMSYEKTQFRYQLQVSVTGAPLSSYNVDIFLRNVNEAPVLSDGTGYEVCEKQASGASVYTVGSSLSVSDQDYQVYYDFHCDIWTFYYYYSSYSYYRYYYLYVYLDYDSDRYYVDWYSYYPSCPSYYQRGNLAWDGYDATYGRKVVTGDIYETYSLIGEYF